MIIPSEYIFTNKNLISHQSVAWNVFVQLVTFKLPMTANLPGGGAGWVRGGGFMKNLRSLRVNPSWELVFRKKNFSWIHCFFCLFFFNIANMQFFFLVEIVLDSLSTNKTFPASPRSPADLTVLLFQISLYPESFLPNLQTFARKQEFLQRFYFCIRKDAQQLFLTGWIEREGRLNYVVLFFAS